MSFLSKAELIKMSSKNLSLWTDDETLNFVLSVFHLPRGTRPILLLSKLHEILVQKSPLKENLLRFRVKDMNMEMLQTFELLSFSKKTPIKFFFGKKNFFLFGQYEVYSSWENNSILFEFEKSEVLRFENVLFDVYARRCELRPGDSCYFVSMAETDYAYMEKKYQLKEYKKRLFMLKETPLFSGLPFKTLAPIFHKATQKTLEQGDTVYRKGKTIDHVIIVETGSLEYMTFESGKTIKLLTPGNIFGVKETLEQIKSLGFLRSNERKTRILLFGKQDLEKIMSNKQVKLNVDSILKQAGTTTTTINVIPPLRTTRLSKFESTNNFSHSLTSREYFGSNCSIYNRNLTPRKNLGSLSSRESFLNFNSGNSSGQSLTSREELSTTRKSFNSNRRNNSTSLDLKTEFVDDIVFNPLYQRNEEGKGIVSKKKIRLDLKDLKLKSKMT